MRLVQEVPPLPEREPDTHKGTYGRVLLLAGSEGMTGAAILAARAAYRAGAGLVTVGIERKLFSTISTAVPEAIFLDTGALTGEAIAAKIEGFDAVVVGPGLGTGSASHALALGVLQHRSGPAVLDADALNIIAALPWTTADRRPDRIWTPHPGEFARLTGEQPRGDEERLAAARRFLAARGGVLVLKGHHTVVADGDRYGVNRTGNPGMATAGAGDVLSGVIAAFLGQGLGPFEAARAAVHLHGRAGDLAAAALGEISLTAGDVIDYLPRAILEHPRATVPPVKGPLGP